MIIVFIRNTNFQLLAFCASFLKQSTVTYLFIIFYETFFKKELLVFPKGVEQSSEARFQRSERTMKDNREDGPDFSQNYC